MGDSVDCKTTAKTFYYHYENTALHATLRSICVKSDKIHTLQ